MDSVATSIWEKTLHRSLGLTNRDIAYIIDIMETFLSEFEFLVLAATARLGDDAYAVTMRFGRAQQEGPAQQPSSAPAPARQLDRCPTLRRVGSSPKPPSPALNSCSLT